MDKEKFGAWLNEKRKQKGMTQEQLANELNYTKQMVSKWELGKGMPKSDILDHIEKLFGPIPDDFKDLKEYMDFKKLSEVTKCKEYEYMFSTLAEGTEIDSPFASSIKTALYDTLWVALFKYYKDDKKREAFSKGPFGDWYLFILEAGSFISDRDDEVLKDISDNYSLNSTSILKRKLEVFLNQLSDTMDSYGQLSNSKQDPHIFNRDSLCLLNLEQLYNLLPDTDTSWKSSYIAAAYKLLDRLVDVHYATSGLRDFALEEDLGL